LFIRRETAVSIFSGSMNAGYCVTVQDKDELVKAVKFLVENDKYCENQQQGS
jgi:hypothetical protein